MYSALIGLLANHHLKWWLLTDGLPVYRTAGKHLAALVDGEGLALRDRQTALIISVMGHAQAHLRGHGHIVRQRPREVYPDAAAEVAEGLDLRVELNQYGLLVGMLKETSSSEF